MLWKKFTLTKTKVFSNRSRDVDERELKARFDVSYQSNRNDQETWSGISNLHKQCTLISGADGKIPQILLPSLEHSHNTIRTLSELSFMNHPLFGYGYENPIRIHLKIGSDEIVILYRSAHFLEHQFSRRCWSVNQAQVHLRIQSSRSPRLFWSIWCSMPKKKTGIEKLLQSEACMGHLNRLLNNGDEPIHPKWMYSWRRWIVFFAHSETPNWEPHKHLSFFNLIF